MKRLPNLDVLRFLLASMVILYHLPKLSRNQGLPYFDELSIFNRGKEAVYMFFVLSGFLIIMLIYNAKKKNMFSIRHFYMRRVLRIFPLYYLVLIFGFTFYNFILPGLQIDYPINYNLWEGVLLTFFFLPNIFSKLYAPGGILEILWSIGIEEQFYLIIAPLMYFIKRKYVLIVLCLLTVIYFLIFHLDAFEILRRFWFVFFFIFSGGIIVILEMNKRLEFLKKHLFIPVAIVVLTVLFFTTDFLLFENLWVQNGFLCLLFSLFIHTISYNNYKIAIENKLLNYLGTISYGIYMYHVIALNAIVFLFLKIEKFELFGDRITTILINILTFALTILMAHISYKYFESYFLNLKSKYK
ncbi:MAG: acyltransferase [Flavobacteriaceae bacterium]|nr:acyltransferase [Bacteroidia bacterium]NNF74708.1 acyltransferase [Flavobacteriaceae bacterium]NNK73132.1 acyltransferase [Flavobacteriaceae bacterium]